jgi:hypothetical protein
VNPPTDALGSGAIAVEDTPEQLVEADPAKSSAHSSKIYAVPVCDVAPPSGRLAEVIYRAFEIMVALIGLTFALPLILFAALVIRSTRLDRCCSSTSGPRAQSLSVGVISSAEAICSHRPAAMTRIRPITYQATSPW